MTQEQAREYVNRQLQEELPKAPKKVSGYDTYICPLCGNGSGKDGTGISTKDGIHYTCFKCNEFNGDYLGYLRSQDKANKIPEHEIFKRYGLTVDYNSSFTGKTGNKQGDGVPLQTPPPINNQTQKNDTTTDTEKQQVDYTNFILQAIEQLKASTTAQEYLQSRGISTETAVKYGIGFCEKWQHPNNTEKGYNLHSPHIIIPTGTGKHSYTARNITPNPKFKVNNVGSVEMFNKKALKGEKPVFVVEGTFDALSVMEVGGVAVALNGSNSTANKFIDYCKQNKPTAPLIIALDNDTAGQKATQTITEGLKEQNLTVYKYNIADEYNDPNDHLQANSESFEYLIRYISSNPKKSFYQLEHSEEIPTLDFFNKIQREQTKPIPTGFVDLDKALNGGLYAGLYILGAVSSLGKTTFVLQIADQMAEKGQDVLIFSLEMSKDELRAKSISRLTYNIADITNNAKTVTSILTGSKWATYSKTEIDLLNQSRLQHSKIAKHLYITEGVGNIGIEQITKQVTEHIDITGNVPVVIIDYLQIIAPYDMRASDKQNTDKAVLELKRLSRDKKTPVFAISSFNRENYSNPVNLTSFKESGAIEYSSDVLLGLQLAGMDDLKANEKNKQIAKWKKDYPRVAQLKVLKNRNGKVETSLYYNYYTKFNYFAGTDAPPSVDKV